MISKGEEVAKFKIKDHEGEILNSSDIENAVLFFYPEAGTPGCTNEVQEFNNYLERFIQKGFEVYGISINTVEEQKKFHDRENLGFKLLADEEKVLASNFGVENNGYAERTTFVVKDGIIEDIFEKVDPNDHVENLVKALD